MSKKLSSVLVLGLLVAVFAFPVSVRAATVGDVADELLCMCGCTLLLENCSHVECAVQDSMMSTISLMLDEGNSTNDIVQYFVDYYGESVLSAPTKSGFNLIAWVTPFAAIAVGAVIVFVVTRKWVRRGEETEAEIASTIEADGDDDEYQRRLQQELDDFSDRSFR